MTELVIATKNQGKMREIRKLLEDFDIKITSLADYPDAPEIVEDGKTFAANAIKKARIISKYTGKLTMGEDSGIEIKALGNRPGIYSARYSGADATDQKNNAKMLRELRGVPFEQRQARYRCCAALVKGDKVISVVDARCGGYITEKARGENGFGYDPYFLIKRYGKTFGELDPSVKAKISHRARALKRMQKVFEDYLK